MSPSEQDRPLDPETLTTEETVEPIEELVSDEVAPGKDTAEEPPTPEVDASVEDIVPACGCLGGRDRRGD